MTVTHYPSSSRGHIPIAEMNDHHLHNALQQVGTHNGRESELYKALKAEQERRGGPPKPKESR